MDNRRFNGRLCITNIQIPRNEVIIKIIQLLYALRMKKIKKIKKEAEEEDCRPLMSISFDSGPLQTTSLLASLLVHRTTVAF